MNRILVFDYVLILYLFIDCTVVEKQVLRMLIALFTHVPR